MNYSPIYNTNNFGKPPSSSTTMWIDNRGHGYVGMGREHISKSQYLYHYKSIPFQNTLTPRRKWRQQDQRQQISTHDRINDGFFHHSRDKMAVRGSYDNRQYCDYEPKRKRQQKQKHMLQQPQQQQQSRPDLWTHKFQQEQTSFTSIETETTVSCDSSCTSDTSSILLGLEFLDDDEDLDNNVYLSESREEQETKETFRFEYGDDENAVREKPVPAPARLDPVTKRPLQASHSWLRSVLKIVNSALTGKDNDDSDENHSEYVQLKDLIQERRHSLKHSKKKLLWDEKKRNFDRLNGYYGDERDDDTKSQRQECFEALGFFAHFFVDLFRPEQF